MVHFYKAITVYPHLLHHHVIHWTFSPEKVIGCNLPSPQDPYTSRSLRQVEKIVDDPPTLDSPEVH